MSGASVTALVGGNVRRSGLRGRRISKSFARANYFTSVATGTSGGPA
jgi:hypothetical protein